MTRIPEIYLEGIGLPLYWRNEAGGKLPAAIMAYLDGTMTPAQTELVIEYFRYFINAPCWEQGAQTHPDGAGYLAELRSLAEELRDAGGRVCVCGAVFGLWD
jgi:hypothetical protein